MLGLAAFAIVVAGVAAISAYEAHVINVTAKIENALSVMPDEITFGTVFPQEKLNRNLLIKLSDSFLEEDRVDDVDYFIRQKPKPLTPEDEAWCHANVPTTRHEYAQDYLEKCYPLLCYYLSKHPDDGGNDGTLDAFHDMGTDVLGRLVKSEQDTEDEWVIDLDVPCFEGQCAQDWTHEGWELPADLESETFGCDLWVEVSGISVNYLDRVDFGNPASESWHLGMVEDDWSYVGSLSCTDPNSCLKLGNYGGYDGNDADFRGLMGPPTGCQATDPSHAAATFKMDVGMNIEPKKLVLRHLDGSQQDSFDIHADGQLVGHYNWQNPNENWVTTEWNLPAGLNSIVEFELVATDPDTNWCEIGWGQVMFNWAEIQEGTAP